MQREFSEAESSARDIQKENVSALSACPFCDAHESAFIARVLKFACPVIECHIATHCLFVPAITVYNKRDVEKFKIQSFYAPRSFSRETFDNENVGRNNSRGRAFRFFLRGNETGAHFKRTRN